MVDIHSHVVPQVDDGSKSLQDSLDMIKNVSKNGIKTIVATTHYMNGKYEVQRKDLEAKVHSLNQILKMNNIDIKVLLGQEIMVDINIFDLLDKGIIGSINNSRYILIEFDMNNEIANLDIIIKRFKSLGYTPIIAHPERYRYVANDIDIVKKWINSGALLQMNLGSISGIHGSSAQKTLIKLLNENLIHMWGSDLHSFRDTYKDFDSHLTALKKVVKDKNIYDDIINNNARVILDEEIKLHPKAKKRGLFSFK